MRARLYALPYSPWSDRAAWALEHCGQPFEAVMYRSRIGEPALRVRMRKWCGRISVPVLFTAEGDVLDDSVAIARHAHAQARERALFPAGAEAAVERWVRLADRMLAAGRRRTTRSVSADPAALRASLARALPGGGWLPTPVARESARWLLKKYADLDEDRDERAILAEGLTALAAELDGRDTLLAHYSFADIAMATGLHFVAPPQAMRAHIPPEAWPHWGDPELAAAHPDLLAWRDRLYTRRAARPSR